MGKGAGRKNQKLKIVFDPEDRKTFLKNQGMKYSKQERRRFNEKKKTQEIRTERKEQNKIYKKRIEERYEELAQMKKQMNRYADIDSDDESEEVEEIKPKAINESNSRKLE